MRIEVVALLVGIITGAVFTMTKLPLPAPPSMAGIAGIVGIFAGSKLIEVARNFFS
ncbi:XapX domain-containing protein [Wukongibacter sp. M2B1]|uniref:XapX domain-containing protein n=1 Tax=Wukongibacter sp. M2B1 TaxID=3088895 RepID=UPI003D7B3099